MYTVRIRIGDYCNEFETSVNFATLYRSGRSFVKDGKYHERRTSVVISDYFTGNTIVRFYSMKSKNCGAWVAAQSGIGKYHTHIEF